MACVAFNEHAADQMLRKLEGRAGMLTDKDRRMKAAGAHMRQRYANLGASNEADTGQNSATGSKAMDSMLKRLKKRLGHKAPQADETVLKESNQEHASVKVTVTDDDGIPVVACDQPANKDRGVVRGLVLHAETGKPLRNVKLEFDHSQGRCLAATDRYGNFKISMEVWSTDTLHPRRNVRFSKDGFYKTTASFEVSPNAESWVPTFDMVPEAADTKLAELGSSNGDDYISGDILGNLISSATGKKITMDCCKVCNAVRLHLRHGVDMAGGDPVHTHTTSKDGKFHIKNVPPGTYTMQVEAPCYAPHHATVAVIPAQKKKYDNGIVLAPSFGKFDGENKIRFVMTWDKKPDNLLMHLLIADAKEKKTWTEVTHEQSTDHVANFKQRMYNGHGMKIVSKGKGTLHDKPYAEMTHREVSGYGPNEMVIDKMMPGSYTLYVQRIGDQLNSIQKSGAKIAVYENDELINTVVVPSDSISMTKDFWHVMEFSKVDKADGESIFNVNKLTNKVVRREPPRDAFAL